MTNLNTQPSLRPARLAAGAANSSPGWLLNKSFDQVFILGIALLAFASAGIVLIEPSLFPIVLFADIWLLGYHHVISTYTRLFFDAKSRSQNIGLVTWLPLVVAGLVALVGYTQGLWVLSTIYFYWQWWHYSRQSWGVNRAYERKSKVAKPNENPRLFQLVFYGVPLWGMLLKSSQQHEAYLGSEFRSFPVPSIVVNVTGIAALTGLVWLVYRRFRAWQAGVLPIAQTLYLATHFSVFAVGYIFISDITIGWLAINVWHNAQYVAFVWYFNNSRFKGGVEPESRLLSSLSQTRKFPLYILACLLLTSAFYLALSATIVAIVPAIIVYQSINFHHYVVDSVIWKSRSKPKQTSSSLPAAARAG